MSDEARLDSATEFLSADAADKDRQAEIDQLTARCCPCPPPSHCKSQPAPVRSSCSHPRLTAASLDGRTLAIRRAKFGESAFLDVYQKLYEAPDPAPALAAALVRP